MLYMKNASRFAIVLLLCLSLFSVQCDEDHIPNQEADKAILNSLKSEIEILVGSSICNETTQCKYMAFGSKPCGGPWSYLIYSTSIDTAKLEAMVAKYNKLEDDYNRKYKVYSTCEAILPPSNVICENNACVAVN